jgi:penicillin amidase
VSRRTRASGAIASAVTRIRYAAAALLLAGASLASAQSPEAVTILRDRWGVPHVFTSGPGAGERAAYANGYAQAEDRLFEMDILRRAATGHLAEMLGPDYLLMDEVVRRDGYTEAERGRFFARLARRDRHALEAYRDGVNAFIAEITADPQRLPFEFLGAPPAPWTAGDSVAVAVLELLVEGANGGQEVRAAALLLDLLDRFPESEARGIFDDLYWIDEPAAPTTIAAADAPRLRANRDRIERFAPAQLALVRAHAAAIRQAAASLALEQGLMGGLGGHPPFPVGLHRHASNAIVIAPAFSATGHAILLGGPQTGLNQPSFFWEVGFHDGDYEGEGVIAPAGPGILIGRGRNFAMTITSGIDDAVDTYIEVLDPADPGRYRFRGRWLRFERRTETIHVAGAPDVALEVLRSRHGPVFFVDRDAGVAFSRRAAFRGHELESAAAVLNLGRVRSLADFRRLADGMFMSFNFHYADDAGNIAYFHRGALPRRPARTDPRLPLDGAGTMEWAGIDPPRKLPAVVNPARGFITNWNNKPVPGWSAGEQRELWGVADRVQGLGDALEAAHARGAKLSVDDVKGLMRHAAVADVFAVRIVPFLEDAVASLPDLAENAPLREATGRVRAWLDAGASLAAVPDGHGVVPDPGAAIYTAFRARAQAAIFADELADAARPMYFPDVLVGDQEDDHGSFGTPDALFLRVLLAAGPVAGLVAPDGVLPVSRDYFTDVTTGAAHTRAQTLVDALRTALADLAVRFGTSDQSVWLLPALRESYRDLGVISAVFGATEMERENRGSFNLVVDLGSPIRGEIIVPPGESGSFTAADVGHEPPHLRDQLPLYEAFGYRRQAFAPDELEPPVAMETIPVRRRAAIEVPSLAHRTRS